MPSTAATVMVWRLTWFACCSASMPEGYWWPCSTSELGVSFGTSCVLQASPAASGMPEGGPAAQRSSGGPAAQGTAGLGRVGVTSTGWEL